MLKFQLKREFQDGSISPQDYDAGKLFHGSVIHEYAEPTEFILKMVEYGYIEEVVDTQPKKKGK